MTLFIGFIAGWLTCRVIFYINTERHMKAVVLSNRKFLRELAAK